MRYDLYGGPGAAGFIHKRIGGAVKGFVTSGFNPLGALGGFVGGGGGGGGTPQRRRLGRAPVGAVHPSTAIARRSVSSNAGCPQGAWLDSRGRCRTDSGSGTVRTVGRVAGIIRAAQALVPGGRTGFEGLRQAAGMANDVVMGRYGAAYVPGSMMVDRAVCLPGDVVGDDGLCYPRKSLKNDERAWPRGRRPLLTGGEMRAISIASRAAGRLTRTAVRLQDMGLIKKPVAKRPAKKKH